MDILIHPAVKLDGVIRAQPSKNYTTRCLLAAALANGESLVRRPASSADAAALISCLKDLGAIITPDGDDLLIRGFGRSPRHPGALNPGNAGAVLRFLMAVCAILPEIRFVTDYHESLGVRPNQDLLDALACLGVESESRGGCLPVTLRGGGLHGGDVVVRGDKSSQYLSGLLFLAPLVGDEVRIQVTGDLKSRPAVRTTLSVLDKAGIHVDAASDLSRFVIPGGQEYRAGEYVVNGDWPGSASILAAGAVVPGSRVAVNGLFNDEQGERAIVDVLRAMGVEVVFDGACVTVHGPARLLPVDFDGDLATDAVLAMVSAACFADGVSRFFNVANLRLKECDRITEPLEELRRLGVRNGEKPDEIIIHGSPEGYEGGLSLSGRGDHRVIMMLAVCALRTRRGIMITGAEHISKSYPDFFKHICALGAKVELR